jgi:UDP-glucose 4-epimerase
MSLGVLGVSHYFVAGGAGFIGGHLVARLLRDPRASVVVYDNFSSGRAWHLPEPSETGRLRVVRGDLKDLDRLKVSLPPGTDLVVHLASNPDIARATTQPDIDFWEGTYLTQNLLEAMRFQGVGRIIYASGSGVYGDSDERPVSESDVPLEPISTYGASKLACEALIRAYCHLFGMSGVALRFANVVGPRQTHGVAFDFVRRLLRDPGRLSILGDGLQSKPYIDVEDVLDALFLLAEEGSSGLEVFNVATEDSLTVNEIAAMCVERTGAAGASFDYSGGDRGWKGDVPVVRFDTSKLRARGWTNARSSREAMRHAIDSMVEDARAGRFDVER